MKVAILDDLQNIALWISAGLAVRRRAAIMVFNDRLSEPTVIVERLRPFDVVSVTRDRIMAALTRYGSKCRRTISLFLGNGVFGGALWLLTFGAVICAGQSGNAQSQPVPTDGGIPPDASPPTVSLAQPFENWMTQPTMTGDWGGLRTKLSQYGFNFKGSYIGEYAYNFSGGKGIGGDYAQQWTWGVDVDMDRAAGLTGGTFHVGFNQREGRSTSADYIGNKFAVQEIYGGGENLRITALSYEQRLFGQALDLKAGYLVMGDDFARTALLCIFENVAFCAHQQTLPNDSGWTDYPNSRWGVEAILNLPDQIYAETAVTDVNPTYGLHNNGLKLSLQGSTGMLFAQEFGKSVELGPAAMPGHYKIGGYYDTSQVPGAANPDMAYSGRYGGYILADQMVWSFQPGTDRGLMVVANASVHDKRTSPITPYFTIALIAQGPFASRPHDSIAIGYVRDFVNRDQITRQQALLTARGLQSSGLALGENIVEVAYGFQATPWMAIHPNLQYIGNPGAFSFQHIPNAWVFGVHIGLIY